MQRLKANDVGVRWDPPQIDVQPKTYEYFEEPDERFTLHMYLRKGDDFEHAASVRYTSEAEMIDEAKWERWRMRQKEYYGERESLPIQ